MITRALAGICLLYAGVTPADDAFHVYWHDSVPQTCKAIAPVHYSKSFSSKSVEAKVPGGEMRRRFQESCRALAKEKGANALSDEGVTHFHGKGFFGYECDGTALKC